jgi:hypothetical protein
MEVPVNRRILTLLACAVSVLAAACSSSNSNSATIPPPHSVEKSAAISLGDSVCQALAADQQKFVDDFKISVPQPKAEEARDFVASTLTPRIEQAVGDFHRIGEPTKDKQDWDKLVSGLDQSLADFKAKIATDPIGLLTVKPFAAQASRFFNLGLPQCTVLSV